MRATIGLGLVVTLAACGPPVGRAETTSPSASAVGASQAAVSPTGPDCSNPDHLIQWHQQSMQPAIQPEDLLLVAPQSSYAVGDIVAFRSPPDFAQSEELFVKRIVAQGGDAVELRDGSVVVNGNVLVEPYVWPGREPFERTEAATDEPARWVVQSGSVFLLGDHRAASADSRVFGPVPVTSIVGRITWRCKPSAGPVS